MSVGSIAVFCVVSLLSYNVLQDVALGGVNFNGFLEFLYESILLPVGGLLIAVFAGWVMKREASKDELTSLNAVGYALWRFLIRFIVPPALLVIIVSGLT